MTFDFDTDPKYEPYLNYSFGVFAIICALVSTVLNPLIVYFWHRKPRSVKNLLFVVVAISDFLTNLVPTPFISYVFLSPENFNQFSILNQIPEFLCCTFGCISQVTVSLMALTRMIKIIRPFLKIKFRWVLSYLIAYAVYMAFGNVGHLVAAVIKGGHNQNENLDMSLLEKWNKFACFSINLVHCFVGIICSLVTVGYLLINMKGIGDKSSKLRGSNTILIMNIPYVVSIVTNLLARYQAVQLNFSLVNHYIIPIFTSAFNPCVVLTRTKNLRGADGGTSSTKSCTQQSTALGRNSQYGRSTRVYYQPALTPTPRSFPRKSLAVNTTSVPGGGDAGKLKP